MLEKNTKTRDFLELMETVLTIVVSLMALSGTFAAYKNGFFHKLNHVIEHYHEEALVSERKMAENLAEVRLNTVHIANEQMQLDNQQREINAEWKRP